MQFIDLKAQYAALKTETDPATYCLDAASLEKQIKAVLDEGRLTPKCVVAVDIYGNPARPFSPPK